MKTIKSGNIDDLTVEQKVIFMSQLRKYYPKREVDLDWLFIKVVELDSASKRRLSHLRIVSGDKDAFLIIGYNVCELYIENKLERGKIE